MLQRNLIFDFEWNEENSISGAIPTAICVHVLRVMSGIAAVFELIRSAIKTSGPHPFRLK